MGLLDDAIREHLDLKRKHGAGEDDVRRQEQEALGPPRREAAPEEARAEEAAPEPGADAVPEGGPVDSEPERHTEPFTEVTEEPRPEAPAPEPEAPGGGEDVLEETPEFLQETPEHDRLWFEQKPPRDFDFDDDK
jgi:hypothetical protein